MRRLESGDDVDGDYIMMLFRCQDAYQPEEIDEMMELAMEVALMIISMIIFHNNNHDNHHDNHDDHDDHDDHDNHHNCDAGGQLQVLPEDLQQVEPAELVHP